MADVHDPLLILLDLTRCLTSGVSLEESLGAVTDASIPLLGADHASIRLIDHDGTTLLCGARSGSGTQHAPLTFRPREGISGWVVHHGALVCLDDATTDERFVARSDQGFGVRSILAVPLWSAGRTIGVLSVSHAEIGRFDDKAQLLGQLLANCAVPAIEHARLERIAITDAHTRAFNRRYLVPRLEEEMARSGRKTAPLSLLLMDLDHFKRVNDEHGHAAGDRVLREFADRVRDVTRVQDALVRWGGEEFVLIMPDTSTDRALAVAERVREDVAERRFDVGDNASVVQTVSIGVATWDGQEAPEELERRADRAMYQAKGSGRDQVVIADA